MQAQSRLQQQLQIAHPIIQAPMAGGATTAELVAAVSNAGGLGSLGAGYMQPEALRQAIQAIRRLTDKPFQVNLFVPSQSIVNSQQMQMACQAITAASHALCITTEPMPGPYAPDFESQVSVLLEERVAVVSFTFGLPERSIVSTLQAADVVLIGAASTKEEAKLVERAGFDAVVMQGREAGGHRVSFVGDASCSLHRLADLLRDVLPVVNIPVIAAGGIMVGADIQNVLSQGAAAAQLGTAFLTATEAGIPEVYKSALLSQTKDTTVLTRAFSGKLARGIANVFTEAMKEHADAIVDYPVQNKLTAHMRACAKQQGNSDYLSLWAGQCAFRSRRLAASELMAELVAECNGVA